MEPLSYHSDTCPASTRWQCPMSLYLAWSILIAATISEESQSQERTVHYNTNGERTDTFNLVDEDRSEKISASLEITLI